MKKSINTIILFITLFTSCDQTKKEEKSIKDTFESYKSAILNDKGEEAVKYVDSRTIKYYGDILRLSKEADSTTVNSLSLMDKLMVFSIRHRTSKNEILSFDKKGLFVYAIKSGMVGKNSVSNNTIGEVTIDNNFAKGEFIANGQKTDIYFHFYKEEDQWKIDLTSIFPESMVAFKKMVKDSGLSENEYLFSLLEMLTGKKPGSEIWAKIS